MKELIHFEREDFCPNCYSEKALLIFDDSNNVVYYPGILDSEDYSIFEKSEKGRVFSYMKCKYCGKEFFIDWSQGIPPKPMFAYFYRNFIRNFKMTKLY